MLEIDKNTFNILVNLVEKSKMNDFLYNFIIHYRREEGNSQNSIWLFEKPFKSFVNVIMCKDDTKASKLMEKYLIEEWYAGHKDMGWYDCHKHHEKLYFGYWSFESGAIVKNVPYYPYDMVYFKAK
nr:PoNe immunity protein domain-containing protein [Bacillus pseudomycoides]